MKFVPTEPRDYEAHVRVQRGESCPERTVQLRGRGVTSCLSWTSSPAGDAEGRLLHFGFAAPGQTVAGSVAYSNVCSLPVNLSELRTSSTIFAVTRASPGDLTKLEVPPASRDPDGTWTPGTASVALSFSPTDLGVRVGTLDAQSSIASESRVSAPLQGFGGGPRIDLRPSPTFALGRIGFDPSTSSGLAVLRTLRIGNVGNRPTPADPRVNLKLGQGGAGAPYWSVRAINGSLDELCLGAWDSISERCDGTLSGATYDANVGLEAGLGVVVPVRVMPSSPGRKEWEVTVFSNDQTTPDAIVRITADAVVAPPCHFSAAPTYLSFGLLDAGEQRDLTFTLTNLGTAPGEVCFFNGIELSQGSDPSFTVLAASSELELQAGQSETITVRALGQAMGVNPVQASGAVTFNVSNGSMPQGAVLLQATVAPACITASPRPLAFGDTELECGSPDRAVVITNSCATSVTVNTTTVTEGASAPVGSGSCTTPGGCDQFVLTSLPAPGPLTPGQSRTALVRFQPYLAGTHTGELTVTVQQGSSTVPLRVALQGTGRPRTSQSCGVSVMCPGPITVNANTTVSLTPTVVSPATM
ncbi:MAG TPA: choice-of-anchor D domain-containing protein, partial [Archangium sp.]